jgi:hypothetical protein
MILLWLLLPGSQRLLGASFQPLFVIERDTNSNIVQYEARIDNGRFDPKEPVIAYWIMKAEHGQRQDLNFFERRLAYGVSVRKESHSEVLRMTIAAYKDREILVYAEGETARAQIMIAQRQAHLQRIYISARRALFSWAVNYIELFGLDVATGKPLYERIIPR